MAICTIAFDPHSGYGQIDCNRFCIWRIDFLYPVAGTHIIGAAALSMITRGNVLASLGGTLLGNPWTFPPMWWLAYKVGEISFHVFGGHLVDMPDHITLAFLWDEISRHPMDLVVPWIVGGFILMALYWPLFYILSYRMVSQLRHKHNCHHPHDQQHARKRVAT